METSVTVAAPLLVSGRDEAALRAQARRWADWLAAHAEVAWADVVRTAALHRTHFERRAALFVDDIAQATQALGALADDRPHAAVTLGKASGGALAMLFTGQGSQRLEMGRGVYGRPGFELFTGAFDAAVAACDAHLDQPLRQVMWSSEAGSASAALLDQTRYTQPALFALEVALFRQWEGWGVRPQFVLGHSVGELACAHVAEVLSLEDAAALVCARGRLMQELATSGGKMASLEASEEETRAALAELSQALRAQLDIAGLNTSRQTVISGSAEAVEALVCHFETTGRKVARLKVSHAFHSAHMDGMLEAFGQVAERLAYHPPTLTVVSNVTGKQADVARGELVSADYWVRQVRQPVRFAEGVRSVLQAGARILLECGPQGVLGAMSAECVSLADDTNGLGQIAILTSLHKGEEHKALLAALGGLHAQGHGIDWKSLLAGSGSGPVALPTYAFQRQHYWLEPPKSRVDIPSLGLSSTGHAVLRVSSPLADSEGELLSGRLSLSEHAWLADHKVFERVILPGTGMVELALAAGLAVGSPRLLELTLAVPLLVPAKDGLRVQVQMEAADAEGRRALSLHSRDEASGNGSGGWTRHALGVLAGPGEAGDEPPGITRLEDWPPAGATALEVADLYARLRAGGLDYGPVFQGVRAAWREGNVIYGEVALPAGAADAAGEYGIHPALFDAALHVLAAAEGFAAAADGRVLLPFAWSDVRLHARGASELRVRVELSASGSEGAEQASASLLMCDGTGQPVVTVGGLTLRRATAEQVRAAVRSEREALYRVSWPAVPLGQSVVAPEKVVVVGGSGDLAAVLGVGHVADVAGLRARLDGGAPVPERVIVDARTRSFAGTAAGIELPSAVQSETARVLEDVQALLSDVRLAPAVLLWVTSSAISTGADDGVADLVHAPLWGLLRSTRTEHSDRVLRLLDVEGEELSGEQLWPLLAADAEPELAWRNQRALAARLQTVGPADEALSQTSPGVPWSSGTVLITGGLGELGRALARHFVGHHGVRHLVLTSRRGRAAPGAEELEASLRSLGAQTVVVAACDVGERAELAQVLDAIGCEPPLTGVFHLAGELDDGVVSELTGERLRRVLRPKVDGAWHLHELTKDQDISAFVLFSSVAGVMGGPGQANYAAGNTFLDALAAHRRKQGLSGQSLAWGLWEPQGTGMTAQLGPAQLMRIRRAGLRPLSLETGLALLDAALLRAEAGVVAAPLDLGVLQRYAEQAPVPALLRTLVRPGLRRVGAAGIAASALRRRLTGLPEKERLGALVALVQEVVAAVLGLAGAAAVPAGQPLKELGLDSLMAVEIRNQLSARAETRLPTTLLFDYPTPEAIAKLLLRQAFAELDATAQSATILRHASDEPIAIVAMSCRTPGGVADAQGYWALLAEGRDAIGPFPARWDSEALYDPDPEARGKSYAREGGFLRDVDQFDASFFGISPREAVSMDPQQRLVLEVAWEALEQAGLVPGALNESSTGVYLGSMGSDYGQGGASLDVLDGYVGTGQASSVLSGRVSYALGLQGPAMTVDTACSSSLVALHLACAGLRQGECDLALAGGVQVMSTPSYFVEFSRLRGLAPDGRCKSFSANADGVGWSEGCGILVLKRLADAERDGDRVLAVVRGSAVNQDGRSQGLTAPNGPSQQRVIRRALSVSGLLPSDIDAVEAHGTGTTLGDPIEAGALAEVFGPTRRDGEPLYLGSCKSNLGHTSAAAGVLSVMKMVLALQHERLPRTLHAETPSSHIAWDGSGLSLLQEARPWPHRAERKRRAGVSSFGVSGTNAHAIVEEAPLRAAPMETSVTVAAPLLVSGRDEAALRAQARAWADWLAAHAEVAWADVVRTAALHRTHFERRAALFVDDIAQATQALGALADDRPHAAVTLGKASGGALAMLFTGQGSQRLEMGRGVYGRPGFELFTGAFDAAVAACDAHLDQPLRQVMWSSEAGSASAALLDQTRYTQPALFALEVALFRQWEGWGVRPQFVLGHSVGELACAHVAEVLSLEDAAALVCARGRLMQELATSGGKMASLEASEEETRAALAELSQALRAQLDIAGLNTSRQTVISGSAEAVEALVCHFETTGRKVARLKVSHAFHSAHMDGMLEAFGQVAERLAYHPPTLTVVSNVTGKQADVARGELVSADYWVRQVRQPVRFAEGVRSVLQAGARILLECGPQGVLGAMSAECVSLADDTNGLGQIAILTSLHKGEEHKALLAALGGLHAQGHGIDWKSLLAGSGSGPVALPTYAFQRQHYWLEPPKSRVDIPSLGLSSTGHAVLRVSSPLADSEGELLSGRLSLSEHAWLADHKVFERVILPGTGMVELALAAGLAVGSPRLLELTLAVPLLVPAKDGLRVQVQMEAADAEGRRALSLHSRDEASGNGSGGWTRHALGVLAGPGEAGDEPPGITRLEDWPPAGATALEVADLYARLRAGGLDYGPVFQGVRAAWREGNVIYGEVALPAGAADAAGEYGIHPALFDAALHVLAAAEGFAAAADGRVLLPFAWSDVRLHARGASELRVRVELSASGSEGAEQASASLLMCDGTGQPVVTVGGLTLRRATAEQVRAAVRSEREALYRVSWPAVPLGQSVVAPEKVVVVGGSGDLAAVLGVGHVADVAGLRARLDGGAPVPERVIVDARTRSFAGTAAGIELPSAVQSETARVLEDVQALLSDVRLAPAVLLWVTSSAISTGADDGVADLVHAPLWGLLRSTRTEHSDRVLRLLDVEGEELSGEQLWPLLAADAEPELAWRNQRALAARLQTVGPADEALSQTSPGVPWSSGTVLITGGLGELGRALARHFVGHHGVRHLVLTSRRGRAAPGAEELEASLRSLGAQTVVVAACDVGERAELAQVLDAIGCEPPLTGVFHLAGELDDGVVSELTGERLRRVLRPKVDGAWHLHELTKDQDISAFVLFSSVAGVMGGPGQANYAAGNTFLDALAAHRRKQGLSGQSLAWGLWEPQGTGMTAQLGPAQLMRIRRAGLRPLSLETGLALLDAALLRAEAGVVAAPLDLGVLQRYAEQAPVPALLRTLVRPGLRRVGAAGIAASALRRRLTGLPEKERLGALVALVQEVVAAVLGLAGAAAVPAGQPLKELGLDSLMAVEIRNQLSARAETRLPTTLLFDYPTPEAIAKLLLRQAFAELDATAQSATILRHASDEPIAIVAMSCRTPGGVADAQGYWALLAEGRDAIGPFPARWDSEALYDPDPEARGKSYAREGGFLRDVDQFDASFFGISPREAVSMDPQQRLVLEVAWEALEQAGLVPGALNESSTGVYLGSMGSDYGQGGASLDVLDGYVGTGQASSVLSGRVSYALGLQGPAMTVDTACSSSLVALHLACAGLRQGECDLALAGGVQVMSTPSYFVEFSRLRGLAPDGRCKSFSANADGVGWSEGCGILVLKRLADAERDGDRVLAVVRGSAVNQDGRSQGLTAPNGPSQQRVIRRALSVSGLLPSDIDAVEAHGTGTTLGDPIEAGALAEVFGPTRRDGEPLYLGSCKSNLGHTSAAAGVLSVMKMVLALQHERLPRTLHAETPSSHIAWDGSGLSLLQEARPWPHRAERKRRAGVSSFGVSGTNAHAIVEEAPLRAAPMETSVTVAAPLLVSGRDEAALRAQARAWADWLAAHAEVAWADVVRTAALHRTHFERRAALFVDDIAQATQALGALADDRPHAAVTLGKASGGALAMLFTGQGSQRLEMGRGVYGRPGFELFTGAFDAAVAACDAHLDQPLRQVMWSSEAGSASAALLDQTRYTQPALFALEVALFRQWEGWGVRPQFVLGHSVGELACAHVAEVLSLEDAAALVCARGRLMQELATSGGKMASLEASEEETRAALAELSQALRAQLDIAGLNTSRQTVISGSAEAVEALVCHFETTGRKVARLKVSHAFHSAHMDGMLEAFGQVAERLAYHPPTLTVVSNVTGKQADVARGELVSADYWVRQVRQPVRFAEGVRSVLQAGARILLECGPQGVLGAMSAECVSLADDTNGLGQIAILTSLHKGEEHKALLAALGGLHAQGHGIDWKSLLAGSGSGPVALPTYAFQRQHYWLEPPKSRVDIPSLGLSSTGHAVLRVSSPLADSEGELLSGRLSLSEHAWLADHKVFERVILPGTGMVELALAAGLAVGSPRLLELTLAVPLLVPAKDGLRVQVQMEAADAEGRRALSLHSRDEASGNGSGGWTRHALGVLAGPGEAGDEPPGITRLEDWPPAGATALEVADLYARLRAGGLDYGPVFQGVRAAWREGNVIYGEVALPAGAADAAGEYGIHPALFDAALHVLAAAEGFAAAADGRVLLPFAWSDVRLHARGASELRVRVELSASGSEGAEQASASLLMCDGTGQPVVTVGGLTLRRATAEQVRAAVRSEREALYRVSWPAVPLGQSVVAPEKVVVVGGSGDLAAVLGVGHVADVAGLRARLDGGAPVPERVIVDARTRSFAGTAAGIELPSAVQSETARVLEDVQALLSDVRLAPAVLLWVTSSAISTGADDGVADLVHAPLWGLLRSTRTEHSDRVLRLLDVEGEELSGEQLWPLLAADAEPELAWRNQRALAARLQTVGPADEALSQTSPGVPWSSGTVLITGGLGELGRALARHFVGHHGVRHLVLTSRRGRAAPGAEELEASLRSLGAQTVVVAACDVGERAELAQVLDAIGCEPPLTGVFHLAGELDDGVVSELTGERLRRVLRPKVDGAWHLHELTKDQDISAFVLFSSVAGVMGGPGQANYAAGNTFLDALAAHRRKQGLSGQSLAWGLWEPQGTGMTAQLGPAQLMRIRRAGLRPLSLETGLALLDAALLRAEAGVVAAPLDLGVLQRYAEQAPVPALLRTLVRPGLRRVGAAGIAASALRRRLTGLPEKERLGALVALVQEVVAAVLGLAGAAAVPAGQPLKELGLDSLMAVEIRNQLSARAETRLPTTLLFDYPTPEAIAELLLEQFDLSARPRWSDTEIRTKLSQMSITTLRKLGLVDVLMAQPSTQSVMKEDESQDISAMIRELGEESLLDLAEKMLGTGKRSGARQPGAPDASNLGL